jgi:hypothetical protein
MTRPPTGDNVYVVPKAFDARASIMYDKCYTLVADRNAPDLQRAQFAR